MRRVLFACAIVLLVVLLAVPMASLGGGDVLRVAYDPNLPPLHTYEEGEHRGFLIDLLEQINEELQREITLMPMDQEDAFTSLQSGEVDMVLSASFNEQRAVSMNYTDTVLVTSVGLVVSVENDQVEGLSQLSGLRTAIQQDTMEYEFLRTVRRIYYNTTSNQRAAMELLLRGRADAFVGNVLTADYMLDRSGQRDQFRIVDASVLPIDYAIAVSRDNPSLLEELNEEIRDLKQSGEYSELLEEWFGNDNLVTERLWMAIQVTGTLLVVVLMFTFLAVRWNRRLQREVDKKTHVLKELNDTLQDQMTQAKNSDEFQRQILESSPRGIITVNEEGVITSINAKALAVGYEGKSVVGEHYEQFALFKKLLKKHFHQVFHEKKSLLGKEAMWKTKDATLNLRYFVYPLFDIQREMIGAILTFEDVTEERKMRLQVFEQEKSQALSRVVAGIAHEIRNPLTSIKTFAELIPRKFDNERFRQEVSTAVPKEIDRVNHLIEGLIDYAKPRQQEKEQVELTEIVNECTVLFERTLLNKGITLQKEIAPNVSMFANADQLKQAIINLIINGIDAIEEEGVGGTLTITLKQEATRIFLYIKDTGVGLTEEEQKKVLEPFFTTKPKGTGLGLAITQQYVTDNGGTLEIMSEKGQGATMLLTFRSDDDEKNHDYRR